MSNLSIRPLYKDDIESIVQYWFDSDRMFLTKLGVDLSKFGSRESFAQMLEQVCETPIEQAKLYYCVWLVDEKPMGYACLRDIVHHKIAHMHLHIWDKINRGKSLGGSLFALSAVEFYRLFNLKMILCEPMASNPAPNRLLKKIGFEKWRTYYCASSEVSLPGDVNSYLIEAEVAAEFLKT